MAPSANLVAKRKELEEKRTGLANVFKAAGEAGEGGLDFSAKPVLEMLGAADSMDAVLKARALNTEIDKIYDSAQEMADLEEIDEKLDRMAGDLKNPDKPRHVDPTARAGPWGIGDLIVGSDVFKAYAENGPSKGEVEGYSLRDLKATLFETSSGWAPESVRSGRIVEAVTRPIQVLDIIPSGPTDEAAYVYLEETLRTHSGVEMVEGGTYAEDAYELTDRAATVRKIGTSIPVTDEQLEDVAGIQSYLNNRLTFGLRQRFDGQVLTGDGTPPNIEGILNHGGIQTQARGGDPTPDAIHKAMTKCRVTGRSFPQNIVMHPNDWESIRLLRTADGIYIWGSPSEAGEARIWGLPVVQSDAQTENTALVGDFTFCQIFERRGIDVQVGFTGTQFMEGKRTIRADFRVAFAIFRGSAFCTVTGI
jgi:HK97 family phage major capsid protein